LSKRAFEVLSASETVVGYHTYIDLIEPLITGRRVIRTGMMKEVDRVAAALDAALAGERTAIVSSGDPGIYAMAGLVFEMCRDRRLAVQPPTGDPSRGGETEGALVIEVIPGIPALSAGASLLGAPLTHDFAVISLSDLLTPWEVIARRLEAAAAADFVIVLYNPKSKRRHRNLAMAQDIVLGHRAPETPVGIVTAAMRSLQHVEIVDLKSLHEAEVGMQTTVFIGSSASVVYRDFMVTPRGYGEKYRLI